MGKTQLKLLTKRQFLPLFLVQLFGSLNDNFFRSALVVMITYQFGANNIAWLNAAVMVALCSALLVIPFPFLSPLAGQLADKYDKAFLIRIVKCCEQLIMVVTCYGFVTQNVFLLMFLLFLSGVQSAFFGPLKYSIIADHLPKNEMLAGNSLLSSASYSATLLGLILGGLAFEFANGGVLVGVSLAIFAFIGMVASRLIPRGVAASPNLVIDYHFIREACFIINHVRSNPPVFFAILGLSWFMLVSVIFMGQFATYSHAIGADSDVYTLFLGVFLIGISLGSLSCNFFLKGKISALYTPIAAGMISFGILGLVATSTLAAPHQPLANVQEFLDDYQNWLLLLSMFMIAFAGGVYMVPLHTITQSMAHDAHRARVIAARNILYSVFITTAMVICAALLAIGFSVLDLIMILGTLNFIVAIFAIYLQPVLFNRVLRKLEIPFQIKGYNL